MTTPSPLTSLMRSISDPTALHRRSQAGILFLHAATRLLCLMASLHVKFRQ
jgi:hypothetical protein